MSRAAVKACVFDAYGTLFDVGAAARALAAEKPEGDPFKAHWAALAETWRRKQLEYSWLRAAAGRHVDFAAVTADALDYALEAHGLEGAQPIGPESGPESGPSTLRARLLGLYDVLGPYPEAEAALAALKAQGQALAILSNGAPGMLGSAVAAAGFERFFEALLSAESVGVFKPDPSVYAMATDRFDCAREEILFISANGWDVCNAAAYGFRTVWINRRREPMDRLGALPDAMISDLTPLPDHVAQWGAEGEKDA